MMMMMSSDDSTIGNTHTVHFARKVVAACHQREVKVVRLCKFGIACSMAHRCFKPRAAESGIGEPPVIDVRGEASSFFVW